jgi:hypothetical protein
MEGIYWCSENPIFCGLALAALSPLWVPFMPCVIADSVFGTDCNGKVYVPFQEKLGKIFRSEKHVEYYLKTGQSTPAHQKIMTLLRESEAEVETMNDEEISRKLLSALENVSDELKIKSEQQYK